MPINFGNADTLNRTQRLFDNPTGWSGRVVQMLGRAFGGDNVFGTAAVLDTGTSGGEIPVIDSDGSLSAAFNDASVDTSGLTTLGALESPDDARRILGAAIDTIGGSALAVRRVPRLEVQGSRTNRGFISRLDLTQRRSLLLISAAGGNAALTRDIFGLIRMQSVELIPTSTADANSQRIHINSGRPPLINNGVIDITGLTSYRTLDGSAEDNTGETMQFLSDAQLRAFGLSWGFRLRRFGAVTGDLYGTDNQSDRRNGYSPREFYERRDADLLIAYKPGMSGMFYETNLTDRDRFVSTAYPFSSSSGGSSAGADGFALEILL